MDIQERLTAFAMLGASWVMWLLVILSVICVAIIIERGWYFIRTRDNVDALKVELLSFLRRGQVDRAIQRLKASSSLEAKVAHAGLDAAGSGREVARERMAGETALARLSMERNLAFLGTVGNNAPFVGLLGTVIGIIGAFHELNESQGQVSAGLMTEIGEALVATAIGLLVALPAVAFYNAFQRMIKGRMARADALTSDVLAYLHGPAAEPAGFGGLAEEEPARASDDEDKPVAKKKAKKSSTKSEG